MNNTAPKQLALNLQLNPQSTFANFVVAQKNQIIIDCLQTFNTPTILLHATQGEGLTHLLQAACHDVFPALYLPLQQHALFSPQILQGVGRLKLLALDDIDAICGNTVWEHALFQAFNEAMAGGAHLLWATHIALPQLHFSLADLTSRVHAMLYFSLHSLNDEEKIKMLIKEAKQRGFTLLPEVARYIIQHFSRDTKSLLHLLVQLDRLSLQTQRKITIPLVKQIIPTIFLSEQQ